MTTDLFAERGYHGTSMRQLAEHVERQASGFYYYFSGKYDILLAIIDQATTLLETEAAAVDQDLPPADRLIQLVEGHVRVHLEHTSLTRVCDRELRVLEGQDLKSELARLNTYEQIFCDALQQGVKSGDFAKDLNVAVTAKSILLMASGVSEWWRAAGPLSVDETAAMISGFGLSVARSGATSPKPR